MQWPRSSASCTRFDIWKLGLGLYGTRNVGADESAEHFERNDTTTNSDSSSNNNSNVHMKCFRLHMATVSAGIL